MSTTFKQKLGQGKPIFGPLITLPSAETAEVIAGAGFDWLFIDCEHGNIDVAGVQSILQTVGNKCHCIARTPLNDEIWIKRLLDTGVEGIIVPQVNSAEEVRRAVSYCKYPPAGKRSVGLARAHGYGAVFKEYVERANKDIAVIIQVEHVEGVRNVGSIVNEPGVDCIFVGPYDLSASLGMTGQVQSPVVQEAIHTVVKACKDKGMPMGIFGVNAEAVLPWIEKGFTLIASSTDTLMLGSAAGKMLKHLRGQKS